MGLFVHIYSERGFTTMDNANVHSGRDYSGFDEMSTESLKEILSQDSRLPAGTGYDMDAILYIMEVVERREAEQSSSQFTPVDEAWQQFKARYREEDCDGTSLYEDEEDAAPELVVVPNRKT